MIAPSALQMRLLVLTSWLDRREREALAYLLEENRLLRASVTSGGRSRRSSTTIIVNGIIKDSRTR